MRTYKSALDAKLEEENKFDQKYTNGCTYQELRDYKWPVRKEWGNWVFKSTNLVLQLLAKHGNCVYEIDLEKINSTAEMLDVIFQLNHKQMYHLQLILR